MSKNKICELLQIEYPVIQAPMNWVAGAELVGAVSKAGGLGTIGPNAGASEITDDVEQTGETLRAQIRRVREITDKPFAVNVAVGFGGGLQFSKKVVQIVLEEKVPVAVVSVGPPNVYTDTLKEAGIKVLHAISTSEHARKAEKLGVDAVICEGYEAGGHKGLLELTTFCLTPMVADAVSIPVITGGGIGDARGVLAAMALGADGVYMGTRFMVTKESESHDSVKELVVKGHDACTETLNKGFMLARDLGNNFTKKFKELAEKGASGDELMEMCLGAQHRAQHLGEAEEAEICCGQVAGLIRQVDGAEAVIEEIRARMGSLLGEVKGKLSGLL